MKNNSDRLFNLWLILQIVLVALFALNMQIFEPIIKYFNKLFLLIPIIIIVDLILIIIAKIKYRKIKKITIALIISIIEIVILLSITFLLFVFIRALIDGLSKVDFKEFLRGLS